MPLELASLFISQLNSTEMSDLIEMLHLLMDANVPIGVDAYFCSMAFDSAFRLLVIFFMLFIYCFNWIYFCMSDFSLCTAFCMQ